MSAIKFHFALLFSACLWMNTASVNADDKIDTTKETSRLVKVLNSNKDTYAKAMACRRLAAIGDQSAVESIAKYLGDEKLATYARSALENIPGKASSAALRGALKNVQGNQLVGVINSISKRKDSQATSDLIPLLSDKNTKVAFAAAHALGSIGTKPAANALLAAIGKGDKKLQGEVGFGCLMCARSLAKQG
ncbi:MAG: HEAT repeat domain-containing protein, partial [Gimesia sp.]|nr:HEAT repeat domain-containing protein [Gimesia sp.]